ncbi:MAG: hypothetical protein E7207_04910 [Clostridium butyricum]|nr:hypothetical protein [Clostridium butyricum]
MINKKKLFIFTTISLAIIFTLTYFIADKYIMKNKNIKNNNTTVAAQNTEKNISADTKICLVSGEQTDEELTLNELKHKFNLDSDLTISKLCSALSEIGYEFDNENDSELIFKRDNCKKVNPNKYYIGEKEGFLAIYKSDEKGNLFIEKDSDVYRQNKKVEMLPKHDKDKISSFQLEYDNKDDAEEDLTEFLS